MAEMEDISRIPDATAMELFEPAIARGDFVGHTKDVPGNGDRPGIACAYIGAYPHSSVYLYNKEFHIINRNLKRVADKIEALDSAGTAKLLQQSADETKAALSAANNALQTGQEGNRSGQRALS